MNTELFKDALCAVLCAHDAQEMTQSGRSIIVDAAVDLEGEQEEMEAAYMVFASSAMGAAKAYMDCFEEFGVEEEFSKWTENEHHFEEALDKLAKELLVQCRIMEQSSRYAEEQQMSEWIN